MKILVIEYGLFSEKRYPVERQGNPYPGHQSKFDNIVDID